MNLEFFDLSPFFVNLLFSSFFINNKLSRKLSGWQPGWGYRFLLATLITVVNKKTKIRSFVGAWFGKLDRRDMTKKNYLNFFSTKGWQYNSCLGEEK